MKTTIKAVAATVLLAVTLQTHAATEIYENNEGYSAPSGSQMVMDAWIAKPIQAVMVAGGAVTWAVSLPFTYATNTHEDAWVSLVEKPADELQRCLGCTELQDQNRLIYEERQNQSQNQEQYEYTYQE